ncbi:hypothetical protein C163_07160 [Pseudomonas sp. FGI182]|uniref:hypothetical protein n=1 Tax=Pseudomonas sp. FGI182 TaxID=1259844 RepID=UPI0003D869EC|nr:hypothetical protein [Pseudomonas sp. FGI182]AHD17201.1 hypothetical protein C163_07160 [Pseudomonas sp. FGI182]
MSSTADNSPIASLGQRPHSSNPKPVIAGLTQDLEVDLDALGGANLKASIRGANLQAGDVVLSNWRGLDAEGVAFDLVADGTVVTDPDNVIVEIDNKIVTAARGGYAFLSYQVNDSASDESLRQFCYVGLRSASRLPVVQVLQSHGLEIVKKDVQHLNVVAAAYQAIQEGDKAKLIVRRFRSNGNELTPAFETPLISQQKFKGEPLEWLVPKSAFNTVTTGGYLEIGYKVELKDGSELEASRVQKFMIRDGIDIGTLLPAPRVENGGSDEIDPGNYANGLPVAIDAYTQRAVGDYMMLAWVLASGEAHVQVVRVDQSSLVAKQFVLRIAHEWLVASLGAVQVFYQYGREGHSLTSEVLSLKVTRPRLTPPMPTVRGSSSTGAADEYNINAFDIRKSGAYVIIPAEADLREGEDFEVHWQGESNAGRVIIKTPDAEGPRVFNVPADFVAANMGTTPSKRFEVFYRIVDRETNLYWESKPVKLLILPLAEERYQLIDCPEANASGELVLAPGGATLTLAPWAFINDNQLLSIHLTGVAPDDRPVAEVLRDSVPVSESEVKAGVIDALSYAVLDKLKSGDKFFVWASVSFDGTQWWSFPKLDLTLKK